jgi:hypothetical protein
MSSSETNWLTLLSSTLEFSSSFLKVFDEKLVEQARSLTGINLRSGDYGFLPPDSGFEVQYKQLDSFNVASIDGYLVGPDAVGHPVTAIWYSSSLPNERINPASQLPEDTKLEVYWAEFPIDEFRAYTKPILPPIEIPTKLSFQVEWRTITWPDVHLELQAQDSYSEAQIAQIEDAIDRIISHWNEQPDDKGKVHYRSNIHLLNSSQLKIHIDFGSASKDIVQLLLQDLDNIAKPNFVRKVTFSS